MKHGFIKVAAASPVIKVADADYNAGRIIECIKDAGEKGVKILVFPELSITGASCYDLIGHRVILEGAKEALLKIVKATSGMDMLVFVGLPLAVGSRLYSCAAAVCGGELLGLVPRSSVEGSHFALPDEEEVEVILGGESVPVFTDMLFENQLIPGLSVAVAFKTGLFNIGSGRAETWNALARAAFAALDRPVNIEYIDMPETLRDRYQYYTRAEMGKLFSLGWSRPAASLDDAVADYLKNYLVPGKYLGDE